MNESDKKIVEACLYECIRQGTGYREVGCLIESYWFAKEISRTLLPERSTIQKVAQLVEPQINNGGRYRKVPASFEVGRLAMDANKIPFAMESLEDFVERVQDEEDIDKWVKLFLDIHPFADGNGRIAFILHNWLSKTMDFPHPLPEFYGEDRV